MARITQWAPLATVALGWALAGCSGPHVSGVASPGLQHAAADYPPMILGGNVHPATGAEVPRACPATGSRIEQKGGPSFDYLGADPANSAICVMRVDGQVVRGWYAIWLLDWPGAATAGPALGRLMHGRSGDMEALETNMAPGYDFYDLMRNEGVEDIELLGKTYRALKISHYREGTAGNGYRSVSTVWKDIPSGMLVYATYHHIAGRPELDDPLIPTAIAPAPGG